MRTTWETGRTKISPSPVSPVYAAETIASTARSVSSAGTTLSTLSLGSRLMFAV
jgi:hypothetical protein